MAKYYTRIDEQEIGFEVSQTGEGTVVRVFEPGGDAGEVAHVDMSPVHCSPTSGEGLYSLLKDGKSYQLYVQRTDAGYRISIWRHRFDLQVLTEREYRLQKLAPKSAATSGQVLITAPMPGLVKAVTVSAADQVKAGQRLVVLEAMKMENDINSPREGKIAQVHVSPGTVVEGGKALVTLE